MSTPSFQRIAIVNRGEPAVRLIRAVEELRSDGEADLRTIALYTEPDRTAPFVRAADEAVCLGSATFVDPADSRRKNRYLDYEALERALRESRAEAVWVGWGFVSEHAAFADLCSQLGIVFIGPDARVMRALGDKIGSKRMAEQAGVPVAPWSDGPVSTPGEARSVAERLGFPLMVKATAGGGGRGIRRVRSMDELDEAFESARSEALAGFGDDTVFMERLVEGARHVEVQIVGDGQGTTWALGVRDCSVQRRNQKVLEESPSPGLDPAQHREICEAAARLGDLAGYRGAGTVEFLYDPRERAFSFMEVNARLQVEHPVTELVTGLDLVKLQIHVARGGMLKGDPPAARGHAIEARVNAEDPARGFAPSPGRIELLRLPGGPGLRVDSGFAEGDTVAPEFDSMIAKLIAFGRDRGEALARLERGLRSMQLAVRGGASNKGFLLGLLARDEVRSGEVDVGWLDRMAAEGEHLTDALADVALVQGAIDGYDAEHAIERSQFYSTAARGRLRLRRDVGASVELRHAGNAYEMRVRRVAPRHYRVELDGRTVSVEVDRLGPLERHLTFGERRYRVLSLSEGADPLVEVEGIPHRLSRDDVGMVRSPAPAIVVSLSVSKGDPVTRGDRLAVLESMKSELGVTAPCDGRVRAVLVSPNTQVEAGAPLVLIEPEERTEEASGAERVTLGALAELQQPAEGKRERCREVLEELRRFALGFDVDALELEALSSELARLSAALPADDPDLLAGEQEILAVFADQAALLHRIRTRREGEGSDLRTPEEYLLLFLRSLDTEAAGLSPAYVERLRRALLHYDVDSLERSPELEEALLWVCKAHERMDEHAALVRAILERRLEHVHTLSPQAEPGFRHMIDRIVEIAGTRYQALSDLARELRYRTFDRPFFEDVRARVYHEAEARLDEAAASPEAREQAIHALVDCPQPLAPLLAARLESRLGRQRDVSLEVLFRRYYRHRDLENVAVRVAGGRSYAVAEYLHEGARIHAVSTHAAWRDLPELGAELRQMVAGVPAEHEVVLDVYIWGEGAPAEADAAAEHLRRVIEGWGLPRTLRRLVAAVTTPGGGRGMGAVRHFTYRSDGGPDGGDGLREERTVRGLHPMMAKRLQLWRLCNFDVERVASAEDVHLFHGVARDHPRDERLFAFVEVRDITPVRDAEGRVLHYPHLERQVHEAFAAMRLFQSRRSERRRLHWNRITLFVWPTLDLGVADIQEIAHRLAPATEGLGLQKITVRARVRNAATGRLDETLIEIANPGGAEFEVSFGQLADTPIAPLSRYGQRVVRMRQRGMFYPYELIRMLTPPRDGRLTDFPPGEFEEYDLDESGALVRVEREPGSNEANLVVGVIRNFTPRHPEGMARVAIFGDPSRDMGCFAEPECRRIIAAVDLARTLGVPLEWFPISAGAKIAMDSGTENLDWTAAALRHLIEFTQEGGEVNLVVAGVNVGGQSYWNAEATMLMHTRGVLIMTPEASMVLTGKRALDYSGGVSAEDNVGIGGYEKIMGVNGEAQYWARDLGDACGILFRYYEHSYVAPGERSARRAPTEDPRDRDVCAFPYGGGEGAAFERVGDIWNAEKNPGRRKPFAIRNVMRAVVDQDHAPLERWSEMREAESAVVWDVHLGGIPACLIGLESQPVPRLGFVPADGPEQWTPGTLFPLSSKKVARAINAASRSRPVVVLANLSGFDGSPESLRRLQLEFGAEIGRAVVNFQGPIVFCVINRYHGGAYVVFSRRLNESLEVAALEGSYASVIGGAPAAAVVFAGEVDRRAKEDPRVAELEAEIARATGAVQSRLRARWHELYDVVRSEKLGEVADEFDSVHSVERARQVGSLDEILAPSQLRPYVIGALERGLAKAGERP
ncbi:MAG: biotin carboxylase N-terminal domain-containing protein [Myxococcota bacterium]